MSGSRQSDEVFGIETFELGDHKAAVVADEHIVKPNVAAAPFFALNENEVPVNRRAVAVICIVVCAAGREVDGAGDLLVEENVAHRIHDIGVYAEGKFADIACAIVRIKDVVDALVVVCCCFDDFAVLEEQADILKLKALIDAWGVVSNAAVDAVADGGCINFAVRDVAVTCAGDCFLSLDGEGDVSILCCDTHFVRALHQRDERLHSFVHFAVIEVADIEIEVLKGTRAFAGELCHRGVGIAKNDPLGVLYAQLGMHLMRVDGLIVVQHPRV